MKLATITFHVPAGSITTEQEEHLATVITMILCEGRKGEHVACGEHVIEVPDGA